MWIPRDIEPLLQQRAWTRPVVVVTGARQTGKTSIVRRLFPNHAFVSLDLPSTAELAEHSPAEFLKRFPPPLVVDEVQYAPQLFRYLKLTVDEHREDNGQFILTGSQKFALMRAVSDSLAGRAEILELEGLSWSEILSANPQATIEDAILRGGFPELHADTSIEPEAFFRSYVATYLERDLRLLLQVSSLRDYERFLRACALRSAQLLNRTELARDVGIAGSTAGQWLSALEASGQVALVEPWFANRGKSLVKTPKLYLRDVGLCAFLTGVRRRDDLNNSPLVGPLWETLVASELRRSQLHRLGGSDMYFWRDRTKEADFLFHHGGRFELADAKWSELPSDRDAAQLNRIAGELPADSVISRTLICRCQHSFTLSSGVRAMALDDVADAYAARSGDAV